MSNRKLIFTLLIFSIFLICISSASAVDLNDTEIETQDYDDGDILAVDKNDEKCEDAGYELTSKGVNYKFTQTGYYPTDAKLHVSITNSSTGKGIQGKKVSIFVNDKLFTEKSTNKNGLIDVNFKKNPGTYSAEAKLSDNGKSIGKLTFTINGIPTQIEAIQNSAYYKDTKITIKLTNLNTKKGVSGEKISVKFSNGKTATLTTNSNGIATYNVAFKPGTYSLTATTTSKSIKKNQASLNSFPIGKTYLKFDAKNLKTSKKTAKTLNVKVSNYFNNHMMKNVKVTLKVFTGKKSKTVSLTTNSKGIAKLTTSKLSVGKHKVIINTAEKYTDCDKKTVYVTVTK